MNAILRASPLGGRPAVGMPRTYKPANGLVSINARALSLSGSQTSQHTHAFESNGNGTDGNGNNSNESVDSSMVNATNGISQRRQGESCEWPRACEWPMKERRDAAASAMSDAAAAAALSNSMEWTPEAKVYTMNEEIDTDLPPDVELLAYFSDNPISWRAHEPHSSEEDRAAESSAPMWTRAVGKWFSKMWRYQGLS